MQRLKNAFYEHRFGLFFFGIFMVFGFVMLDSMRIVEDHGVAYSFYCVDFSIGFCTKILPGAIYNFLFGKYTETAITIYVKSLIILVFLAIAFLFEAILKNSKSDVRKERFFFLCFAAATICYFFFKAGLVYLLDFHWIIAALLFIICISNKRLYIFIPLTFLYAILTHYVSLICYVAVCLIIVLYKVYKTQDKKEKYMLYGILILSLALVGGTFIYMLLFELDNIKISYPQFISLLENRGVGQLEYYKFAFFRESVEDVFEDYYTEEIKGLIENIDMNQSPIKILIDTVHQQLVINLYLADHEAYLPKLVVFLPGIGFMTDSLVKNMKGRKVFEKLIYLSGIVLFLFVCFFGLLFSTDTIRWIGNAVLTFTIFSLFMLFYSESNNGKTLTSISKLPDGVYYSYLALCFLIPVM